MGMESWHPQTLEIQHSNDRSHIPMALARSGRELVEYTGRRSLVLPPSSAYTGSPRILPESSINDKLHRGTTKEIPESKVDGADGLDRKALAAIVQSRSVA